MGISLDRLYILKKLCKTTQNSGADVNFNRTEPLYKLYSYKKPSSREILNLIKARLIS